MIIPSFKAGYTRVPRLISTTDITSTGSQNYTVPAGTIYLEIEIVGGGGGGGAGRALTSGKNTRYHGGGGGGGGAYVKYTYRGSLHGGFKVGDTLSFTVGTAGSAGSGSTSGGNGGNSTLNSHTQDSTPQLFLTVPTAYGGGGGETESTYNTTASGGVAGVASNGDINTNGNAGSPGSAPGTSPSNGGNGALNGGSSIFGNTTVAAGGNLSTTTGGSGVQPGNGGGGGFSDGFVSAHGGSGGAGQIRIKAYG